MESTEAQDGVVQAAGLQEVFSAGLDLHEGYGGEGFAVVDAAEDVPLDAHCLQGMNSITLQSRTCFFAKKRSIAIQLQSFAFKILFTSVCA